MYFEVRRFKRQRHDAEIQRSISQPLQNLVAEIAIDADVHKRITALEFRENVRKQIKTRCFVRSEGHGALNDIAAVGNNLHRFIAQAKQSLSVFEQNDACRSQLHRFRGAVQQLGLVGLLKLANLRANRRLRAEYFLASLGKALQLGNLNERG